jgi:hypothetical protein
LYKVLPKKRIRTSKNARKSGTFSAADRRQIIANFTRHVRNNCGFVYRAENRLEFLERTGAFESANSEVSFNGHLLASRQFGSSRVIEVVAETLSSYGKLMKSVEQRTLEGVYASFVSDPMAVRSLLKRNYRSDTGSYGVLMSKPLAAVAFDQIYDESFIISRCEFF